MPDEDGLESELSDISSEDLLEIIRDAESIEPRDIDKEERDKVKRDAFKMFLKCGQAMMIFFTVAGITLIGIYLFSVVKGNPNVELKSLLSDSLIIILTVFATLGIEWGLQRS